MTNCTVRYFFCSCENMVFFLAVFSAHPGHLSWGHCTIWGCWSDIFAAYPNLALSSNVSFSNACLCLPSSKCACNAEDRWNVLIQLSSGQLNIPLSCAIISTSSMPSVCWQDWGTKTFAFGGRLVLSCSNDPEAWSLGLYRRLENFQPARGTAITLNAVQWKTFPGPNLVSLPAFLFFFQACKPLGWNRKLLSVLMPTQMIISLLLDNSVILTNLTLTAGIPPFD